MHFTILKKQASMEIQECLLLLLPVQSQEK